MMQTKISDIETKYFDTSDYDIFMREITNTKIKKELVDKSGVSRISK